MITMKVEALANPALWGSYKKLMKLQDLSVTDKMNLVRMAKYMEDELTVARESASGQDSETVEAIMKQDVTFNVSFEMTTESIAEKLTAEDLLALEPLLNKEDV